VTARGSFTRTFTFKEPIIGLNVECVRDDGKLDSLNLADMTDEEVQTYQDLMNATFKKRVEHYRANRDKFPRNYLPTTDGNQA
jgi:hypothetical protein